MNVAISGTGLATAQGSTAEILESKTPHSPTELPWTPNKWNASRICYPALDVDASLSGAGRWRALVRKAFADLGEPVRDTPLLVASCNGDASRNWEQAFDTSALLEGTPWAGKRLPVFSSSCASGIHALFAARHLLTSGVADQVLVLAADILSQSNHENFESLRVLAETPGPPWQSASQGFILGETAVVLKLVRSENGEQLDGPELGSDLGDHNGLSSVIEALSPRNSSLILGQGTGPFQNDAAELAAFSAFVNKDTPLATPLSYFGHTLGASGLLAVALGALTYKRQSIVASLTSPASEANDGRPFCRGGPPWPPVVSNQDCAEDKGFGATGGHGRPPLQKILTTCRALNGACAATGVGGNFRARAQRRKGSWQKSVAPGPLMNETLKCLASHALEHRPSDPPDVLILRLEEPLAPRVSAVIGDRLLPSAVLEITPGFASQLIARCWGFTGPALCLAGDVDHDVYGLNSALHASGLNVFQVNLRGTGDKRVIDWNV